VTTFRYQGEAIAAEYKDGTLVREYTLDGTGTISKVTVPAGQTGTGTYLVTWNGHGDALALYRIESNGTLTLANSYTYTTWGTPTTATHNSIADLGFRFLYVGTADVQWDGAYGLDLLYMHARSYSPSLGRFLQPDPSRSDPGLFAYTGNGPISKVDPSGNCTAVIAPLWPFGTAIAGLTCSPIIISAAIVLISAAIVAVAVKSDTVRQAARTAQNSYEWGKAWERAVTREAARQWGGNYFIRTQVPFFAPVTWVNRTGVHHKTTRVYDLCVYRYSSPGRAVVCYEAKTGTSHDRGQELQDAYVMLHYRVPVITLRGPGWTARYQWQ
jgi:RHS repeat-associated protein